MAIVIYINKYVLWALRFILIIVCVISYIWFHIAPFTQRYLQYSTKLGVYEEDEEELAFPAITICSSERYNISSLCLKGKECNHPEEDDLEWKTVLNWSRSMDEKLTYDERISFGFSSESMIHHCFMKGYGLCKFSTHYYDSLFGNCFTFNADWGLASERVGSFLYESTFPDLSLKEKELKIIIAFNEEDYLLVPMVHIFFHPPDIAPNSRFETFEIHAGSVQSFVISQTTSVKLPPPYTTNCMDYNAIGSSSFRKGILSQFLCQTECEANESLHHCGCIFHFTRDGEYRILSDTYPYTFERQRVENIEVCYDTMKNCFDNETTDVIGFCKSICKIPCRKWPLLAYSDPSHQQVNIKNG
ncbi:epithelial sodium channel subunit gamma-2-like [Tachypleus tridentatus]|uniref:epithelial sodium channel subunit gamma-2-like n=1 Tax=Tachypleus tridentatus TaxID=6853 RepID=UPI003FD1B47A